MEPFRLKETNVNNNSKSTTGQDISSSSLKGTASMLITLDAQMSASGYASDHPWRLQLMAARSSATVGCAVSIGAEASAIIVPSPYSQTHIGDDLSDHLNMRARQLSAVLHVLPVGGYSDQMVQLAKRVACDLVASIRGDLTGRISDEYGGSLLAGQLAELLLMIQSDDGPCDLLWLCQQIADEISAAIKAHNALVEVAA